MDVTTTTNGFFSSEAYNLDEGTSPREENQALIQNTFYATGLALQGAGIMMQYTGELGFQGFNLSGFLTDCAGGATREIGERMVSRSYDDKIDFQQLFVDSLTGIRDGAVNGACASLSNSLITKPLYNLIEREISAAEGTRLFISKAIAYLAENSYREIALTDRERLNDLSENPSEIKSIILNIAAQSLTSAALFTGSISAFNSLLNKVPSIRPLSKANVIASDVAVKEALPLLQKTIKEKQEKAKLL